jgi:hypothetical protein
MDVDDRGHIIVGGTTRDSGLLGRSSSQNLPFAAYIAKGNYYYWAKQIETNDNTSGNTMLFTTVLDATFRFDGERCAFALDRAGYDMSYMIVIFNRDGSLFGAFRENNLNARGKINITGMIYDNFGFITLAIDFSPDGLSTRRQALLTRFNV